MTELAIVERPVIPESWDYDYSVSKTKSIIYKWKNLNYELAEELWIAREKLSHSPSEAAHVMHGTEVPRKTWTQYCKDIGSSKQVVNRWLKLWFQPKQIEKKDENILLPVLGRFAVIVIDPPWPYGTKYDVDARRVASPYKELPLSELYNFKPPSDENSSIWLWTTHRFIQEGFKLLNLWNFEYKITMVWDKEKLGIGSWLRCQAEFCLLGIRGKPNWNLTNQRDIINVPRGKHSAKPDEFYDMVESITQGPLDETYYCDIFAREKRKGWFTTGDELKEGV